MRVNSVPPRIMRASKTLASADKIEAGEEPVAVPEAVGDVLPGGPYFDAVNLSHGWQGYLMGIGFEGHIRTQIMAAVGSYFYEQGSRGDRDLFRAEIEKAIEDSPFLDSGEAWSRGRQEARDYLTAAAGRCRTSTR